MWTPCCCPGVGARKPVLTLPRTKATRPDTLPLVVVPKVLEVLDADRRAQGPRVAPVGHLQAAVGGDVVAVPGARLRRAVGEDGVGATHEALRRVRADRPSRAVARPQAVPLVAPFRAGREAHPVGDRIRLVEAHVDVPLPGPADVERGGRQQTERGVDGIVDEVVGAVHPDGCAQVPVEAAGRDAAHPPTSDASVAVPPVCGVKPSGNRTWNSEAVRVVRHLPQGDRVRHVVGDGDRRAVGLAA